MLVILYQKILCHLFAVCSFLNWLQLKWFLQNLDIWCRTSQKCLLLAKYSIILLPSAYSKMMSLSIEMSSISSGWLKFSFVLNREKHTQISAGFKVGSLELKAIKTTIRPPPWTQKSCFNTTFLSRTEVNDKLGRCTVGVEIRGWNIANNKSKRSVRIRSIDSLSHKDTF